MIQARCDKGNADERCSIYHAVIIILFWEVEASGRGSAGDAKAGY